MCVLERDRLPGSSYRQRWNRGQNGFLEQLKKRCKMRKDLTDRHKERDERDQIEKKDKRENLKKDMKAWKKTSVKVKRREQTACQWHSHPRQLLLALFNKAHTHARTYARARTQIDTHTCTHAVKKVKMSQIWRLTIWHPSYMDVICGGCWAATFKSQVRSLSPVSGCHIYEQVVDCDTAPWW